MASTPWVKQYYRRFYICTVLIIQVPVLHNITFQLYILCPAVEVVQLICIPFNCARVQSAGQYCVCIFNQLINWCIQIYCWTVEFLQLKCIPFNCAECRTVLCYVYIFNQLISWCTEIYCQTVKFIDLIYVCIAM